MRDIKYWIVGLLSCVALTVVADTKSTEILIKLSDKLNSYGSYAVNFNFEIEGSVAGRGEYVVSGNKFYIKVLDNQVLSDGTVKYEINSLDKEVTIDNVDPNDKSMLSNPAKAFQLVDSNFKSTYIGSVQRNGRQCELISLVPLTKGSGFSDVKLWISSDDSLPISVEYKVDGSSIPVVISLAKIEQCQLDKSFFEFSKTKFPNFEIVDFR